MRFVDIAYGLKIKHSLDLWKHFLSISNNFFCPELSVLCLTKTYTLEKFKVWLRGISKWRIQWYILLTTCSIFNLNLFDWKFHHWLTLDDLSKQSLFDYRDNFHCGGGLNRLEIPCQAYFQASDSNVKLKLTTFTSVSKCWALWLMFSIILT